MKPLEFIVGDERPHASRWSSRNIVLAKALFILEQSTCGGCGHLLAETTDPDREGWYEIDGVICAACAALERDQKDAKDAEPGLKRSARLDPNYEKRS